MAIDKGTKRFWVIGGGFLNQNFQNLKNFQNCICRGDPRVVALVTVRMVVYLNQDFQDFRIFRMVLFAKGYYKPDEISPGVEMTTCG